MLQLNLGTLVILWLDQYNENPPKSKIKPLAITQNQVLETKVSHKQTTWLCMYP
jgi:hypothetical protein